MDTRYINDEYAKIGAELILLIDRWGTDWSETE